MTQIVPKHDPETNTFTVDWPGRPEGAPPYFRTLEEAQAFARAQERRIQPPAAPAEPRLTRNQEQRLRSISEARRRHGIHVQVLPPQQEHTIEDVFNEMHPHRHDIRYEQRRLRMNRNR